jgi:putative salt-induced outer membrane protein
MNDRLSRFIWRQTAAVQMPMKPLMFCAALAAACVAHAAVAGTADEFVDNAPQSAYFTQAPKTALPEGSSWYTSAELGAISTTGNTSGTSVTGKIDARQELLNWSNEYIFSGYFKEDDVINGDGSHTRTRSAERYSVSAKAAYKLLEDGNRAFLLGSHVADKFGAYTRYSTLAIGYGTQLLKREDKTIDVEVGPGYFHGENASGGEESGMTVHGAAQLRWRVSPSAQFAQTVNVERGTSNMHTVAETSLSTKINGTMQMKAAFSARNDSNVPVDKKSTDTQTSLTVVYSF